jgi:hypothetical protein
VLLKVSRSEHQEDVKLYRDMSNEKMATVKTTLIMVNLSQC